MARPLRPRLVPPDALRQQEGEDEIVFGVALRWLITSTGGSHTLTAAQQLAARIGSEIVKGRIPAGAPLLEQDLSASLQSSRGPIREALRILEREGLVRIQAQRGAHVTRLTQEEVRDLFEIRGILFAKLASTVAAARDAIVIQELQKGIESLKKEVGPEGTAEAYSAAAFRMALTLAQASPSLRMREMMVSFSLQTLRYSMLGFSLARRRRESLAMWQRLVRMIRAGEAAEVRAMVEDHVEGTCATVLSVMKDVQADAPAARAVPARSAAAVRA